MVGTGILSNNMRSRSPECYTTFWMMTVYSDTLNWSCTAPIFDPITDLDLITEYDFFTYLREVSIEQLQRVWHANRGRLLLWTPGSVPLWDLQVFYVETNLFWTCLVSGILSFENPSVLRTHIKWVQRIIINYFLRPILELTIFY